MVMVSIEPVELEGRNSDCDGDDMHLSTSRLLDHFPLYIPQQALLAGNNWHRDDYQDTIRYSCFVAGLPR